jgi:hypothetical protein
VIDLPRRSFAGRLRRAPIHFLLAYRIARRFHSRSTALVSAFHSTRFLLRPRL